MKSENISFMEKKDLVNYFRKEKIFVSPEAIEVLLTHKELIDKVVEKCKKENIVVVTYDVLKDLLEEETNVKIEYPEEIKEFDINDVLFQLKSRFEFLSPIIIQNNQLKDVYSINRLSKIKKDLEKCIIVGMVKDKTTYTFTLEDFSGNVVIGGEAEDIEKLNLDEVIGVEVIRENEKFIANKFFYPSFSFFRKIPKLEEEVILKNDELVFRNKTLKIKIQSGVKIFIKDVKVFILKFDFLKDCFRGNYLEDISLLLEKRHLKPSFVNTGKIYKNDFFLLREIPEYVIVMDSKENLKKIYKGVQIYFVKNDSLLYLKEGKFL